MERFCNWTGTPVRAAARILGSSAFALMLLLGVMILGRLDASWPL